jgi:hypothetical protein
LHGDGDGGLDHTHVSMHYARSLFLVALYDGVVSSRSHPAPYSEAQCERTFSKSQGNFVFMASVFASSNVYHVMMEFLFPLISLYKEHGGVKPIVIVERETYFDNGFLAWNDDLKKVKSYHTNPAASQSDFSFAKL